MLRYWLCCTELDGWEEEDPLKLPLDATFTWTYCATDSARRIPPLMPHLREPFPLTHSPTVRGREWWIRGHAALPDRGAKGTSALWPPAWPPPHTEEAICLPQPPFPSPLSSLSSIQPLPPISWVQLSQYSLEWINARPIISKLRISESVSVWLCVHFTAEE